MPELFLELFSEEIPARMQARAAEDLARLCTEALGPLSPGEVRSFYGPRRIALSANVADQVGASRTVERGPRTTAPEQALTGFLRKHTASREQLRQEGDYWVLEKSSPAIPAATLVAGALPPLLRRFPWPKSMRWGGSSNFVWVRPLRRIVCLLDGEVVPFDMRDGTDDGHGLASDNLTEGHRFLAPGAFTVASADDWATKLRGRRVLANADDRKREIVKGIAGLAAERQIALVEDAGLLDEVAGLVEWPVPLIGRIDPAYMDLPPEVRQVSMRVNQRYFAFRHPDGSVAPYFGFVDNIEPADGGTASIAGNERVLRARFADARHFWDLDRKARLESRVPLLDGVTFHAKLGSQGERVRRLERLAELIAPLVGTGPALARGAARLAKADLVTGMVGEFPELQGVMGRYYALHDGEDPLVADAVRDHYAPKGPADAVPTAGVSVAVALADKLDQIAAFFLIGEKPSGSGDPYALRRAALGIIRIILEHTAPLRIALRELIREAFATLGRSNPSFASSEDNVDEVFGFIIERLRVQLRAIGARHDVLAAIFAASPDDDIARLVARTDALADFIQTPDGADLLLAYRRAANISRIEQRKGGPSDDDIDFGLIKINDEERLALQTNAASSRIREQIVSDDFAGALSALATLRGPVDAFFDTVTVNAPDPELRLNRLRLLNRLCTTMHRVADFSRIEG
jgi:glycyl-tRNA synthetase beta chain